LLHPKDKRAWSSLGATARHLILGLTKSTNAPGDRTFLVDDQHVLLKANYHEPPAPAAESPMVAADTAAAAAAGTTLVEETSSVLVTLAESPMVAAATTAAGTTLKAPRAIT
jgi:hypothetical protein